MLTTRRIATRARHEILDITADVERIVRDSGIQDGLCVVHVPHTTAAVTLNENADPDVKHDLLAKLAALVPQRESFYEHAEGNSDAHLKTALLGPSITLIIDGGQLLLGTWQGLYFCEFDGPRQRTYHVKLLPSPPPRSV
jgi:secondary thiamine-phosphate synthase enzyme